MASSHWLGLSHMSRCKIKSVFKCFVSLVAHANQLIHNPFLTHAWANHNNL